MKTRFKIALLKLLNTFAKFLVTSNRSFKKMNLPKYEDCEIHLVVCHTDIVLAINAIKTFSDNVRCRIPIIVHTDNDVTDRDIQLLENHLTNIKIITKSEADKLLTVKLGKYHYISLLRNQWQGIKLIDIPLTAKSRKIIILDSDLIFFKEPKEIVDWIKKSKNHNLYLEDYKHFSELSFVEFEIYLGIKRINNYFNSGILCLNLDGYSLEFIEKVLRLIQKTLNERIRFDDERWKIEYRHLVEQTSYLALFSKYQSKKLSNEYVVLPKIKKNFNSVNLSNYACIHFCGESPRYKVYQAILKANYPNLFKYLFILKNYLFGKDKTKLFSTS